MEDLYGTLGLKKGASDAEIKTAYKKLAKMYHPDANPTGEDKFKEVSHAYDVLKDPQKRAAHEHEQFARANMHGRPFTRGGPIPDEMHDIIFNFKDIFGEQDPFSRHQTRRQYSREPVNSDVKIHIELTLEEAYKGCNKTISVNLPSGASEIVKVDVPGGVKEGGFLKYPRMGDNSISDKPRGDLYIHVHIRPHKEYTQVGHNLIANKTISCIDAMLGTTIELITLDKRKLSVTINKGIQHGTVMKLQKEGMPYNNSVGDMHIIINISIPSTLTTEQYKLLQQIKGDSNGG